MKTSVVVFPGSNCDQDVIRAIAQTTGDTVQKVWHGDSALPKQTDLVVLPGGFAYGDYLRCGAMAATSLVMKAVKNHAERGGLVMGICNGFQVLTETRLLPGALLQNDCLHFLCRSVKLRVERNDCAFTSHFICGEIITIPIAHNEGRYTIDAEGLARLEGQGQVLLRYCDAQGNWNNASNPNGAMNNIAGIINEKGNVLGLMPHPERYSDTLLGGNDGRRFWTSIQSWLEGGRL